MIYLLPYEQTTSNSSNVWVRRIFGSQIVFAYVRLNYLNRLHYIYCGKTIEHKHPYLIRAKGGSGITSLHDAKIELDKRLAARDDCVLMSEERVLKLAMLE